MIRTMRALYATLPEPLWIQQVDLVLGRGDRNRGIEVEVVGRGKELHGVDVGRIYEQFSTDFRAHELVPDDDRFEPSTVGTGDAIEFTFHIDFRPKPGEGR